MMMNYPHRAEAPTVVDEALYVLTVDDCPDTTASLAVLLRAWGYVPLIANDGATALELAYRYRPAVIFLDIALPRMNGWELARRLRTIPGLGDSLVAVVSGLGRLQEQEKSLESGCDLHLTKPVDPERLHQLLAAWRSECPCTSSRKS